MAGLLGSTGWNPFGNSGSNSMFGNSPQTSSPAMSPLTNMFNNTNNVFGSNNYSSFNNSMGGINQNNTAQPFNPLQNLYLGQQNQGASNAPIMQPQNNESLRRQMILSQMRQQYEANRQPFAVSPVITSNVQSTPEPQPAWVKWNPREEGKADWANRMISIQKGAGVYNKNYDSYKTLPAYIKDPEYKANLAKAGVVTEKWDRNKESEFAYEQRVNDSLMKVGLNPYHVRFAV